MSRRLRGREKSCLEIDYNVADFTYSSLFLSRALKESVVRGRSITMFISAVNIRSQCWGFYDLGAGEIAGIVSQVHRRKVMYRRTSNKKHKILVVTFLLKVVRCGIYSRMPVQSNASICCHYSRYSVDQ